MMIRCVSVALLVFCSAPLHAVDLGALPRTLARPPALQTKAPKYCWLVFGPKADTRICLVFDDELLHIDRNGNGDLTEPGEKVALRKMPAEATSFRVYDVGVIVEKDGKTRHKELTITRFGRDSNHGQISVRVAGRGEQIAGEDASGTLRFTDQPQTAPIIHFNGPLALSLHAGKNVFKAGAAAKSLYAVIGTPGLGEGTLAILQQENVPEDVHPLAEIVLPAPQPGGKTTTLRVPLVERC